MEKIYYLGYYDLSAEKTNVVLSATNKMDYIMQLLPDYSIEIISPCTGVSGTNKVGSYKEIRKNVYLKTFDSSTSKLGAIRILQRFILTARYRKYLKATIREGSIVIIYHSLGYYKFYKWLKRKLKAKIILETEEIYSDVTKTRFVTREKELRSLSFADGYIFPTQLLNEKINVSDKPNLIIHGTYKVEKDYREKFDDDKIHCVYAGTFDPRKGAMIAVSVAQYLSDKYHIHILGFGDEKDKELLINQIDEISKKTKCKITFEGLKSGEEYSRFIQKCDIGLSPQNPDADFNGTSFPSKILSYMSNGLRVVSVRIPAITASAIGDYLYYYDEQTPEKIAQAIKSVDVHDNYNSREIISELDKQLGEQMKDLIKKI